MKPGVNAGRSPPEGASCTNEVRKRRRLTPGGAVPETTHIEAESGLNRRSLDQQRRRQPLENRPLLDPEQDFDELWKASRRFVWLATQGSSYVLHMFMNQSNVARSAFPPSQTRVWRLA